MPLVKRDKDNNFVESYEIKNFRVDLDSLTILVNLVFHKMTSKGIPTSEPFSFLIEDTVQLGTEEVEKTVQSPKRNNEGAIIMDEGGNPILENSVIRIYETVKTDIKAFSEIISTMTTGGTLYKEIQTAIYSSFQKYQLKDDTFKIE